MELEAFIKKYHPDILNLYNSYCRRGELPSIGTIVKPIGYGYGGHKKLRVINVVKNGQPSGENSVWGGNYIVLKCGNDEYLCDTDNWWMKLGIVNQ